MTHQDLFDRRLANWLADGPSVAPERAIDAAVDHAYRHARRRSPIQRLRRALMSTVPLTPLTNPAHRPWVAAAAVVAVVAIAGLAIAGSLRPLDRAAGNPPVATSSASPAVAPSSKPTTQPTATQPGPVVLPPGAPVAVTGTLDDSNGRACTRNWCEFGFGLIASDSRLSSPFVIKVNGGSTEGTYGVVVFYEPGTIGGGYYFISGMPADKVTWQGEWFTTGFRPIGFGTGEDPASPEASALWPIDTIWLHGVHAYQGYSAVLQVSRVGKVSGWIFTTPAPS